MPDYLVNRKMSRTDFCRSIEPLCLFSLGDLGKSKRVLLPLPCISQEFSRFYGLRTLDSQRGSLICFKSHTREWGSQHLDAVLISEPSLLFFPLNFL